jgi:hypothetical protein
MCYKSPSFISQNSPVGGSVRNFAQVPITLLKWDYLLRRFDRVATKSRRRRHHLAGLECLKNLMRFSTQQYQKLDFPRKR